MTLRISDDFITALHEVGLIPDPKEVRRVVLDFEAGNIPMVHIEKFIDDSVLDVIRALDGVEIQREPKEDERV